MSVQRPRVRLLQMPQLVEAVNEGDDWTGLTDAVARRKRQNRLNVRAYRRRKALASRRNHEATAPVNKTPFQEEPGEPGEPGVPCWVEDKQAVTVLPASIARKFEPKIPLLPQDSSLNATTSDPSAMKIVFPLSLDHLITLLQYNVLRASMVNEQLTSILKQRPSKGCSSAGLHVVPPPSSPQVVPPSLYPTILQLTVPHEEWIDNVPHPVWRDNLLLAAGTYDEDEFYSDTLGGLFEGFPQSESEQRGVIAWWPPWDVSGWELSEGFWRKWRWSLKNCEEVLLATNRWREKRGEDPIRIEEIS